MPTFVVHPGAEPQRIHRPANLLDEPTGDEEQPYRPLSDKAIAAILDDHNSRRFPDGRDRAAVDPFTKTRPREGGLLICYRPSDGLCLGPREGRRELFERQAQLILVGELSDLSEGWLRRIEWAPGWACRVLEPEEEGVS